jgi:hypothetical protein
VEREHGGSLWVGNCLARQLVPRRSERNRARHQLLFRRSSLCEASFSRLRSLSDSWPTIDKKSPELGLLGAAIAAATQV